jgi:site-specific DNA-methyltransferase (adenine-specific)/modification methylase
MPVVPYQGHEGRVILYRADCYKLSIEADAVITDPPYGIRYKSGPNSSKSISSVGKRFTKTVKGDDVPFDPSLWMRYSQVAFTGPQYFYDRLPAGGMLHCWDKRGNYKPLDQADADMVWIKSPSGPAKRPRVLHLAWRGICRHAENREKIVHPTQKPVALMRWMIELCNLAPNSLIYDPYMGSGSTGLAALELGHRFIGVESESEYFQEALRRLSCT